jgi:hypothetical protein
MIKLHVMSALVAALSLTPVRAADTIAKPIDGLLSAGEARRQLPDGEYCIAIFDLLFDNQRLLVTEQFTLSRNASGEWQLANYYLGEKPFYRY